MADKNKITDKSYLQVRNQIYYVFSYAAGDRIDFVSVITNANYGSISRIGMGSSTIVLTCILNNQGPISIANNINDKPAQGTPITLYY